MHEGSWLRVGRRAAAEARASGPRISACTIAVALLAITSPGRAESERREQLRTGEAETREPMTEEPLKSALQNLFLQEDVFPQPAFNTQIGLRTAAYEENAEPGVDLSAVAEVGVGDSWTLSARVPTTLLPGAERGLGNPELAALYSFWVSARENLRVSAALSNVLPTRTAGGDVAAAHDASVIGYVRVAPFHFQAVATLDVSYGREVRDAPRFRPEGALAAIFHLHTFAYVLELAATRNFDELRYLGALGVFWDPGGLELGAALRLDVSDRPVTAGGYLVVSYQFDMPH